MLERKNWRDNIDILLITADTIRHNYFTAKILKKYPTARWIESKRDRFKYYEVPDCEEMRTHFFCLYITEDMFFGRIPEKYKKLLKERRINTILGEEINSDKFYEYITKLDPEVIILYSVPIINKRLIDRFDNLWNVHAGLCPYYRGSSTNLMPIVHKKPEYLGMTVHQVIEKVDCGDIILQGRPEIGVGDNSHTIGCKNTVLATELVLKVINIYKTTGSVPKVKQDLSKGKDYYKKDFDEETLEKMNNLIKKGVLSNYKKKEVDIVEW